jgi:ureidoacrylate peracid hydrolase
MHKIAIPQSVIDRVIARRGREHIYDDLVPGKTALVVVDLQNAFMLPGVAHSLCLTAQEIVPNVNKLARAVRDTGGKIVWIQTAYTEETTRSWSVYYAISKPEQNRKRAEALAPGSKGYALWEALDARKDDIYIEKKRFSAFLQGSSNIAETLRSRGIDTVLITGTMTNVCCESTARDAMMCNFKTIMVADGNAAATDEDHNNSLAAFYLTFGDVMMTDMLIGCLRNNAKTGLAAAE